MLDLELLDAYGLGDVFAGVGSPAAPDNVGRIVKVAQSVWAKVKAPKPAAETVKADSKFVAAAKTDEAAQKLAAEYLHTVAVDVLERFADSPHVLYWLRQSDILSDVLKSEVDYHTYAADKNAPKVTESADDEKARLAKDYRGLKEQADLFFSMIPQPDKVKWPEGAVKVKDGHLIANLDPLQGNYGSSEGSVATGKYAKVWSCTYIVDGRDIVDPREAIREIWLGTNRVGISTGDLFRLVDGEPWAHMNKGETVEFPAADGRKAFSVYRTERNPAHHRRSTVLP